MRLLFGLSVAVAILAFGTTSQGQNTKPQLPPVNTVTAGCVCTKTYVSGSYCNSKCLREIFKNSSVCKAGCSIMPSNPYFKDTLDMQRLQSTTGVTGN